MTKEEYFGDWIKVIDEKLLYSTLHKIYYLYRTESIMPEYKDIFKAFTLCPFENLKVVFLGQDPYPQKGVATGILFGNNKLPISPSLEVIKEAAINYTVPKDSFTFDITLESWAKQGILMINSSFTVKENMPGSHTMIWRPFVASLLAKIGEIKTGIIYCLFGKKAQTFEPYIGKNNFIFKVQHPAYFARTGLKMDSKLFKNINNILFSIYGEQINWINYLDV